MSEDIVARLRKLDRDLLDDEDNITDFSCVDVAADEIERLRSQVEHHARDRVEYCDAWSKWIEENDGLDIAEWCRAYADAVPYPNPDGPNIVLVIHSRLDARHRMAADEIERLRAVVEAWMTYSSRAERDIETLRAERDEARREVCSMNETGLRMNESDKKREAKRRGWDCFKEER